MNRRSHGRRATIPGPLLPSLLALTLSLGGCRPAAGEPPEGEPYIRGRVMERSENGITVARGEGSVTTEPRAVVRIDRRTRLLYRDGEDAPAVELAANREISVWITGSVRESSPVQVDATHIVIEKDLAEPPPAAPAPAQDRAADP